MKTSTCWAVFIFLAILVLAGCDPGPLRNDITDKDGRIVVYHGVNVSGYSKYSADFLPWQTKEDFARLRDWGFNLVRYIVLWEAIEPEEGVYNEAYLDATVQRIQWLEELGVEVLVDLHQDIYCKKYGGDGFPVWSCDDNGIEFTPRQPWNLNYLEPAVIAAYANFWNSDALRGKYIAMAEHLLQRVDGLPNVIGLDIMNEPFNGFALGFEACTLSAFYDDVAAMREKNGFSTPLYFEPVIFMSAGFRTSLTFKPRPGFVFAPHCYDLLCELGMGYSAGGKSWMQRVIRMRVREAERFGTPMLFGEFGLRSDVDGYLDYIDDFVNLMDTYHLSWTYYSFDKGSASDYAILDENGNERENLSHLVRVYPQRIAGADYESALQENRFDLSYTVQAGVTAPAIIFVPPRLQDVRVWVNDTEIEYAHDSPYLTVPNVSVPGTRQTVLIIWTGK